jgi:hypothetical protein
LYGKIFDSIYEGTLYGQWEALVTFQQMIVLCDADGMIDMTPQAIAARTSIPLKIIQKGIKVLEAPDQFSRTPDEEGRRLELIDAHRPWGWHIVNHEKYMRMQDADMIRAQTRERVRKHRATKYDVTVTVGNGSKRHTDTDTNTDKDKETKKDEVAVLPPWLPLEAWKPFLEMRRKKKIANGPRALNMLLTELERLKSLGHDAQAVIDQSTLKGWTSFYPLKPELANATAEPKAQLCDYCAKPWVGKVNGRRHCNDHSTMAMDNEKPAKVAA